MTDPAPDTTMLGNNLRTIQALLEEQRRIEEQCNAIIRHGSGGGQVSSQLLPSEEVGHGLAVDEAHIARLDTFGSIQELLETQKQLDDRCLAITLQGKGRRGGENEPPVAPPRTCEIEYGDTKVRRIGHCGSYLRRLRLTPY